VSVLAGVAGTVLELHTEQGQVAEIAVVNAMEDVRETPLAVAVTSAVWALVTVPALAVKVAVVAEAATVTEAGTVSSVLLSEIATARDGDGAGPLRVTVQVALAPEEREVGEQTREVNVTAVFGCTVRVVVWMPPFNAAVTTTDRLVETEPAVAVKDALVAPLGTVIEVGTVSAVLLSEMAMV